MVTLKPLGYSISFVFEKRRGNVVDKASAELFTVIACLTGAGACTNATWTEVTGEKPL